MSIIFNIVSLDFSHELSKKAKYIRFSVTALPSHEKQKFYIKSKKLSNVNHSFRIDTGITKITQLVLVVRRKNFIESNPILGKQTINVENLKQDEVIDMSLDFAPYMNEATGKMVKLPGKVHFHVFYDTNTNINNYDQNDAAKINQAYNDAKIVKARKEHNIFKQKKVHITDFDFQ